MWRREGKGLEGKGGEGTGLGRRKERKGKEAQQFLSSMWWEECVTVEMRSVGSSFLPLPAK